MRPGLRVASTPLRNPCSGKPRCRGANSRRFPPTPASIHADRSSVTLDSFVALVGLALTDYIVLKDELIHWRRNRNRREAGRVHGGMEQTCNPRYVNGAQVRTRAERSPGAGPIARTPSKGTLPEPQRCSGRRHADADEPRAAATTAAEAISWDRRSRDRARANAIRAEHGGEAFAFYGGGGRATLGGTGFLALQGLSARPSTSRTLAGEDRDFW